MDASAHSRIDVLEGKVLAQEGHIKELGRKLYEAEASLKDARKDLDTHTGQLANATTNSDVYKVCFTVLGGAIGVAALVWAIASQILSQNGP